MRGRLRDKPELRLQAKSLKACFGVIDLILELKRCRGTASEMVPRLRAAFGEHMRCHIECYGIDGIKPTHHWLWDCLEQFCWMAL